MLHMWGQQVTWILKWHVSLVSVSYRVLLIWSGFFKKWIMCLFLCASFEDPISFYYLVIFIFIGLIWGICSQQRKHWHIPVWSLFLWPVKSNQLYEILKTQLPCKRKCLNHTKGKKGNYNICLNKNGVYQQFIALRLVTNRLKIEKRSK